MSEQPHENSEENFDEEHESEGADRAPEEAVDNMKGLITFMAKHLVDSPDQVEVRETAGGQTSVFELSVAPDDLGKVIGKSGRTAAAMRTILNAASVKARKRAVLEIVE